MHETLQAIRAHLNADPDLIQHQIYLINSPQHIPSTNRLIAYHHIKDKGQIIGTSYIAQITIKVHTINITNHNDHNYSIDLNDPNFIQKIAHNLCQLRVPPADRIFKVVIQDR
jgi:hypothetical protein